MKINCGEILNKFSFIDYVVTDVIIYSKSKSIIFELSGASCLFNEKRIELKKGGIKVEHFKSIKITSFDAKNKITKIIEGKEEKLVQLCEIDFIKNTFIFKGYADKSYNWLEFEIQGGFLEGNFSE